MLLRTIVDESLANRHDSLYYYDAIRSISERVNAILGSVSLNNDERGMVTVMAAIYYSTLAPYCSADDDAKNIAQTMLNLASIMYGIGVLGATTVINLVDSNGPTDVTV